MCMGQCFIALLNNSGWDADFLRGGLQHIETTAYLEGLQPQEYRDLMQDGAPVRQGSVAFEDWLSSMVYGKHYQLVHGC